MLSLASAPQTLVYQRPMHSNFEAKVDSVAASSRLALGETVSTVDRPVPARLERDFGVLSALGADRWVHLSSSTTVAATFTPFRFARLAARWAALGLSVALHGEELLVIRGEGKRLRAVSTCERSVSVRHLTTSLSCFPGRRAREIAGVRGRGDVSPIITHVSARKQWPDSLPDSFRAGSRLAAGQVWRVDSGRLEAPPWPRGGSLSPLSL